MRQRGPVSRRTREALAPGSWRTSQTATRSATSGRCSSPERPTTSTGMSRATRAPWISGEVGRRTAQDGDLAGLLSGAYEVGDGVGEPVDLLGVGAQQGAADHAVAFGAGRGAECLHACVQGAQGLREAVGEVEEAAAAAAVLAERLAGRGAAVGVREVLGEVVEVGDGGAAPAVDGLAGVADRGDRVAGAAAEQACQQDALGDRGVLVLVEEDHPELVAQDARRPRASAGRAGPTVRSGRRSRAGRAHAWPPGSAPPVRRVRGGRRPPRGPCAGRRW